MRSRDPPVITIKSVRKQLFPIIYFYSFVSWRFKLIIVLLTSRFFIFILFDTCFGSHYLRCVKHTLDARGLKMDTQPKHVLNKRKTNLEGNKLLLINLHVKKKFRVQFINEDYWIQFYLEDYRFRSQFLVITPLFSPFPWQALSAVTPSPGRSLTNWSVIDWLVTD